MADRWFMIYIDASRYANTTERTGVENYSFHLINALAKKTPEKITLVTPRKIDLPVRQRVIPFPRLWTQLRLSWECFWNRKMGNLFVPSHVMPIVHPPRTVITIHDVAFRRFPKSYGFWSRQYLDWGARFAVRRAKRILAPSEATKRDLVEFYKADPSRITVIPLGFVPVASSKTAEEKRQILERLGLRAGRYFLFLGRIETKKNVDTLVRAFGQIAGRCPGVQLALAGKLGVGGEKILSQVQNPDIVVAGYVEEEAKQVLLENALAFVFPSRFEGFGIPLLEAMAAGIPILASKIPSSWEVAKDNALFFEAEDVDTLSNLMEKVASDEGLRKTLTEHHAGTLNRYSWEHCAEETWKMLQENADAKE